MNIENFFPKFPNIFNYESAILNPYEEDFNNAIVTKKEFETLKLSKYEELKEKIMGEQYKHQKIISRFLSSVTPYDQLLLFHEMGTGKTCTAIAAIEQLRYEKSSHIKRALIFAKGSRLIKNFIQELLFTCTDGRYIPDNFKVLTDLEKVRRVRKITSEFYNFFTFEKFAKYLTKLSDRDIIDQFSNSIIVIDEVHNIREKMEKHQNKDYDFFKKESFDVYKQFHRMFHLIKYSKILLMSGTVMKSGKITNQHGF